MTDATGSTSVGYHHERRSGRHDEAKATTHGERQVTRRTHAGASASNVVHLERLQPPSPATR